MAGIDQDIDRATPPRHATPADERADGRRRLAAVARLLARSVAHGGALLAVRDPEHLDHVWMPPRDIPPWTCRAADTVRVGATGETVEGHGVIDRTEMTLVTEILRSRRDVSAVVHVHSPHGVAWSAFGRLLEPLSAEGCAFYQDHALFDVPVEVPVSSDDAVRIAAALGDRKAIILRNHGVLTVGATVDEAAWWCMAFERACETQLLTDAAARIGKGAVTIPAAVADANRRHLGSAAHAWRSFQPLYEDIGAEPNDS